MMPSMKWTSSWYRSSVASTAMIALRAGGLRIAMWIELKPPQEIPNMPTFPFEKGCFESQSITTSPSSLFDLAVLVGDEPCLRCSPCRGCPRAPPRSRASRSRSTARGCGRAPRSCGRAGIPASPESARWAPAPSGPNRSAASRTPSGRSIEASSIRIPYFEGDAGSTAPAAIAAPATDRPTANRSGHRGERARRLMTTRPVEYKEGLQDAVRDGCLPGRSSSFPLAP